MQVKTLMKWGIAAAIFVAVLYIYFFYIDFSNGCFVKILPTYEFSNLTIKRALKAMKYAEPEDYRYFCKYVGTVNPTLGCGGFNGGCFYDPGSSPYRDGKTVYISTAQGNVGWTAGVLLHEACHAAQFQEKRGYSEEECHEMDDKLLRRITEL